MDYSTLRFWFFESTESVVTTRANNVASTKQNLHASSCTTNHKQITANISSCISNRNLQVISYIPGKAIMAPPRQIQGTIGSRIRVVLGDDGDSWLLLLNNDDGNAKWQSKLWKSIPDGLARQINNCVSKGRDITYVDFGPTIRGMSMVSRPTVVAAIVGGVDWIQRRMMQ